MTSEVNPISATDWWRDAVIYQVYPRSFCASGGTGFGDLPGITQKLPELRKLGVDAVWLSPFYTSPQNDAGYDVADYCGVDSLFGTLADAEELIRSAHGLGLRIIVDLVPNHSSSEHEWFQQALASPPGSSERDRYMFRDGAGDGSEPPNNWQSVFGGPAWTRVVDADGTPGQWYLHLFDSSQPDFNWENPEVWDFFDEVLRFWLDRGVDGFRIDVAHGLMKVPGLPSLSPEDLADTRPDAKKPYWNQEKVHDVYRRWHRVLDEYGPDRILTAEAWVWPLESMAQYVREDEMQHAFNFAYLSTSWNADSVKSVVDHSLGAFGAVGAPSTWVLSNHDVIRHSSRLALGALDSVVPGGLGPKSADKPDPEVAMRRGRAATTFMLGLPGSSYLYQGEELGLPEVIDIPDDKREDPTFHRTNGERYGRDGCRVPIPWEKDAPAYGFSPSGESWLPQPAIFGELARDQQEGVAGSTLELYKTLLQLRKSEGLGRGELHWSDTGKPDVLAYLNGEITVMCNFGDTPVGLPDGDVVASSENEQDDSLHPGHAVWIRSRSNG